MALSKETSGLFQSQFSRTKKRRSAFGVGRGLEKPSFV
jgi:hypothetical protein